MKNLITLFSSLTLSSLMISVPMSPVFAQSANENPANNSPVNETQSQEVLTKTITFAKEGRTEEKLTVEGTSSQIIEVISIASVLYDSNIDMPAIRLASQLILAGADPLETGNLMLALNGMAVEGQDVDVNKLNNAINAYNAIVDKADAETIASLKNTEAFMDIGELLKELRVPIG